MRFSVTVLIDDLGKLLVSAPAIISKYENSDPDFPAAVFTWIHQAERTLEKCGLAETAAISAIKGKLLAAKSGILEAGFIQTSRLQAKRRVRAGVCALLFGQGQAILGGLYDTMSKKREEALKYIRQMIMLMEQQGAIPLQEPLGHSQALACIFASMRKNPGSITAARHVLSLVNLADVYRLLDEALTEWGVEP